MARKSVPYSLFFFKRYNIAHITVKRITKRIQGFCAYCFTLFYSVKRISRKALFENKVIFSYPLSKKGFVKRFVTNQQNHRLNFIIFKILTILNILSIILINLWR